jgi:F-type H+-transporting ATPase subunit alpha
VGGAAQVKAMRQVAGSLRLDLSQYRELEAFAAFGSDLDAASAAALGRGERLVELLKQSQYSPFPVAEEVVSIWLGTSGQLDKVPVGDIRRFETEFLDHLRRNENGILDEIRDTGKLPDETIERLEGVVRDFTGRFTTSDGSTIAPKDEPVDAMDEDDEDRESVKVNRPGPSGGGSGGSNGAAADSSDGGSDGASDGGSEGGSDGGSPSGSSSKG